MPAVSEQIRKLVVPASQLRRVCQPLSKARPETVEPREPFFGQQRAVDALRFAIDMEREGYNAYVLGPLGSHRHKLVEELAKERALSRPAPDDWCYINNFADPERPRALRLPAGKGTEFRDNMRTLIDEMRLAIPAAFEADDYRSQLKALEADTQKEVEQQWRSLETQASSKGIAVLQTPTGYVLAPLRDGKVIDDKEFDKLPEEQRKEIQAAVQSLGDELHLRIEQMPKLRKRHLERVRALDREVTAHAVKLLLDELRQSYQEFPDVLGYLDEVQQNIIENAQEFRQTEEPGLPFLKKDTSALFAAYEVNLVVRNEPDDGAPIIYEPNPSYPNLIGKVEHRAEMGALLTDFRMVRSGALLQANGGYLVLDIHRVLGRPFVWEALKQSLFTRQVRIESPAETLGFVSTGTLKPEPIPLDVKIMLIGERWLYYLLSAYDNEFGVLFKVAADFDDDLERSTDNVAAYAQLVKERIRECGLLPFRATAVRRVIEQRARKAEDSERLSMHMRSLDDLLMQADYWARRRGAKQVAVDDLREAIRQRDRRLDRVQNRVVDAIRRGTLLVDTSGECVGQVNGLAVLDLGESQFGHPVRITATTRVGTGDVVDIEREVELGGAIHSKGMMILSAALSSRFAPHLPLSMHGSVVFEQSYSGVEGDSASVAELCALMSSLSELPIRQNIAVTGSINQLGRVQAVGGINEKIEGFHAVCMERGLDGTHGVIIPESNVKHLMLNDDVVASVRSRKFRVYAVTHIDEAIEILTGVTAGKRGKAGEFPEGSVNRKVEDQLIRYAEDRKHFAEGQDSDEQDE